MLKKSLGAALLALMMGAAPSMAWADCIRTFYNNSAYAYRMTLFEEPSCRLPRQNPGPGYVPGFGNPTAWIVLPGEAILYGWNNSAECLTHLRIEKGAYSGPNRTPRGRSDLFVPSGYISGWALSYPTFDIASCAYIEHDGSTAAHNLVLNDPAQGDVIILPH